MSTVPDSENWRKKYFDSLTQAENEQRELRAMEAALKRLAGRLCTASLGQSPLLDEQLKQLQAAIRRDAKSADLERLTPALTDAIRLLDDGVALTATAAPLPATSVSAPQATLQAAETKSAKTPPEPAPVDDRVRAIVAALLVELKRDAELVPQIDALDSKLASMTQDQWPEVLASLTQVIGQRIQRIERAKEEIEALLSQMVGKLEEMGQFVAEQNRSQSESHASSETLNIKLAGEMKAMGESVDAASDLQQIRVQVRSRLDSIDRHLQEFRQREAALAEEMQSRNEQMRSRIAQLEAEANRLHDELKDEQRASTIDVLTKIPNRLAYEKRIDEELKRWQRFRQPTCIAVWDVDHFKRINDSYGHRAGDRVLLAVAECLSGRIRGTDFLARYGGEEFVMILPGTRLDDALRVIDEMRIAVSNIGFHFRGNPVSITISSGVTVIADADSAGSAFERADKALYQAKEDGRNRCVSE